MNAAQIFARMEVPVLMDLIVINANVLMDIQVLIANKVSTLIAVCFAASKYSNTLLCVTACRACKLWGSNAFPFSLRHCIDIVVVVVNF